MTQDKMRKVITACVVAATTLLVVLFSVLIYQWITMAVLDNRIAAQEAEKARLEAIIAQGNGDAEYYESVVGKEWLAYQQDWIYPQGDN